MRREARDTFACFGSSCSVLVMEDGPGGGADGAVAAARACLVSWHDRFTRFMPDSELSRLNADPRRVVPVTPVMARFASAVVEAAELTGGLVDATLLGELERAGYVGDLGEGLPLSTALGLAPSRRPAGPRAGSPWRMLSVDYSALTVERPPGLMLDSGGLAKGLFADVIAETLTGYASFAVECAGDVRVGGIPRQVLVASPFDGSALHAFELSDVGIATSGIGRRSWLDARGAPAHHLLDPSTGRPAFTGVVQATAIAPTALEAEARAKAAVLSGPERAASWLPHGGVIVLDDGSARVLQPSLASMSPAPARKSSWASSTRPTVSSSRPASAAMRVRSMPTSIGRSRG
jgi:thiamine biosynthesis lipoprotein